MPVTGLTAHHSSQDPTRPRFHFCAPAGWMNDPNGTVFYPGYDHVCCQWNPYGDGWGNIDWGHARSRDLLTWEHLPAALGDAELITWRKHPRKSNEPAAAGPAG